MLHFEDEYEVAYQTKFRALRPIIDKHFAAFEPGKIVDMTHRFIATEKAALYESWNYNKQQKSLSGLRAQLQKASKHLKAIHPVVLQEIAVNLTLPIVVLNGTEDEKSCAAEVFNLAPSKEEVDAATHVLKGLLKYSENIDKAIKYTQDELPVGIAVGSRKIDAWKVVEAAAELSRTYDCPIDVPAGMNGSGPMRRLLVDLFEHYKITANVDSAYNGWLKHIDRKREFLELLPID